MQKKITITFKSDDNERTLPEVDGYVVVSWNHGEGGAFASSVHSHEMLEFEGVEGLHADGNDLVRALTMISMSMTRHPVGEVQLMGHAAKAALNEGKAAIERHLAGQTAPEG